MAIDDPDFWTKVVGLSKGVDGMENGSIVRKRKCRSDMNYTDAGTLHSFPFLKFQ